MIKHGEFIISNSWPFVKHGHARSELIKIQKIVRDQGAECKIVAIGRKFGDIRFASIGQWATSAGLTKRRFLKGAIDQLICREIAWSLEKAERSIDVNSEILTCITSTRSSHLKYLLPRLTKSRKLCIRLLDSPKSLDEWREFIEVLSSRRIPISLGWETQKSFRLSQDWFTETLHVPNIHSLEKESDDINSRRNRIGIFWPVGHGAIHSEVANFLQQLREFSVVVKLPGNLSISDFSNSYGGRVKFLTGTVTQEELERALQEVRVAILPHRNYSDRGSGYATYFATNKVHIITREENGFFEEMQDYTKVISLTENYQNLAELSDSCSKEKVTAKSDLFDYSLDKWMQFLNLVNVR